MIIKLLYVSVGKIVNLTVENGYRDDRINLVILSCCFYSTQHIYPVCFGRNINERS